MRKKILVSIAVLMSACAAQAFAWGIGVEGGLPIPGLGGLPGSNVMVTAKFDQLPLLGVGLGFNGSGLNNIGITADWWLIQEPFAGLLGVYLGPGAYVALVTAGSGEFSAGARLPIGLQIFPLRWFELFIEVAPAIGFRSNAPYWGWNLQAAAGLRFWFNKK
jgi:hypothetical protein